TTIWRVKEEVVAGLGTKAQLGLVERQVTRGGDRAVRRENEWIVRLAVADQNVAVQRKVIRAAVGKFEPKLRVGCRRDFIEDQCRFGGKDKGREQFRSEQQIIGSRFRLMQFDGEHV